MVPRPRPPATVSAASFITGRGCRSDRLTPSTSLDGPSLLPPASGESIGLPPEHRRPLPPLLAMPPRHRRPSSTPGRRPREQRGCDSIRTAEGREALPEEDCGHGHSCGGTGGFGTGIGAGGGEDFRERERDPHSLFAGSPLRSHSCGPLKGKPQHNPDQELPYRQRHRPQPIPMRRHGWQLPLHPLQVVGMAVFAFLVAAFYTFLGPFLGNRVAENTIIKIEKDTLPDALLTTLRAMFNGLLQGKSSIYDMLKSLKNVRVILINLAIRLPVGVNFIGGNVYSEILARDTLYREKSKHTSLVTSSAISCA